MARSIGEAKCPEAVANDQPPGFGDEGPGARGKRGYAATAVASRAEASHETSFRRNSRGRTRQCAVRTPTLDFHRAGHVLDFCCCPSRLARLSRITWLGWGSCGRVVAAQYGTERSRVERKTSKWSMKRAHVRGSRGFDGGHHADSSAT